MDYNFSIEQCSQNLKLIKMIAKLGRKKQWQVKYILFKNGLAL